MPASLIQALSTALKDLKGDPNNSENHKNLALICKELGHLDQAKISISRAIQLNLVDASLYRIQGEIYKALGRFDEALKSNHQALAIDPNHADAIINLGYIHRKLGNLDQALAYALQAIKFKSSSTCNAYNLLALVLQSPRNTINSRSLDPIESIDTELRKLKPPGADNGKISKLEVQKFILEALTIAGSLNHHLNTTLSQIYYVEQPEAPNCSAFDSFFRAHRAIAKRCHSCYKIHLVAKSLDELLMLHFFMKTVKLESSNTRKCVVELRQNQNNLYKGIIHCSAIDEAKQTAKEILLQCQKRTSLTPDIIILRGCPHFREQYPDYGGINALAGAQEGPMQREEWANKEAQFFNQKNSTPINETTSEFNLGELLIIKNWISYAKALGNPIDVFGHPGLDGTSDEFLEKVGIMQGARISS